MVRKAVPINMPTYMRLRMQIRADIIAGQWELGDHLTLKELGEFYDVSNVPVREALLQLQGEGLVEMRMNHGAVVVEVDASYIDNMSAVREVLQMLLVGKAASRPHPAETMAELQQRLLAFEAATATGKSTDIYDIDLQLHECIESLGGNRHAADLLQPRRGLLHAFVRSRPDHLPTDLAMWGLRNRDLVRALLDQRPATAQKLVADHVEAQRRYFHQLLVLPRRPSRRG